MKLFEIKQMPSTKEQIHESMMRSYHILQKVKDYLRDGVPSKVLLEIINELESN